MCLGVTAGKQESFARSLTGSLNKVWEAFGEIVNRLRYTNKMSVILSGLSVKMNLLSGIGPTGKLGRHVCLFV